MGEKFLYVKDSLPLSVDDLRELTNLLETQNTTDRLEPGDYNIDGEYSCIYVTIEEDGDITV